MKRTTQLIEALYSQHGYRPDRITDGLFSELNVSGDARDVLYPLVRDRVQHIVSRMARSQSAWERQQEAERAASRTRQLAEGTAEVRSQRRQRNSASHGSSDPRLRFLTYQVMLSGGAKRYGDFTDADHAERMAMHEVNMIGAARRMASHEWARKELASHGTLTLNQIPAEQLLADLPRTGVIT